MSLQPRDMKSQKTVEPLEAGTYPARISAVVDLGMQERPAWQGQEKPPCAMVWLQYTFPGEEYIDPEKGATGEPRVLSEYFPMFSRTVERSKSSIRLTRIDPANKIGSDFSQLAGQAVQVTVVHNPGRGKHEGRVFANVADVTAPMKGVDVPDLETEPVVFDTDAFDQSVFEGLPDYIKDKIEGRLGKDQAAKGGQDDTWEL